MKRLIAQFAKLICAPAAVALVILPIWAKPKDSDFPGSARLYGLGRQCRLGKHSACQELGKMALTDRDPRVRAAAVEEGMIDQSQLAKMALEDSDAVVQAAAVTKLVEQFEQPTLAKISTQSRDANVRRIAVGKLKDQSLLASITLQDTDASVRTVAVAKLTDQSLLRSVAVDSTDSSVRDIAVGELTDQSVLSRIAVEDTDAGVRCIAVEKLSDQSLLANIARQDHDAGVRSVAVTKLTDQSLLESIASEDRDAAVRRTAYLQHNVQRLLPLLLPHLVTVSNLLGEEDAMLTESTDKGTVILNFGGGTVKMSLEKSTGQVVVESRSPIEDLTQAICQFSASDLRQVELDTKSIFSETIFIRMKNSKVETTGDKDVPHIRFVTAEGAIRIVSQYRGNSPDTFLKTYTDTSNTKMITIVLWEFPEDRLQQLKSEISAINQLIESAK